MENDTESKYDHSEGSTIDNENNHVFPADNELHHNDGPYDDDDVESNDELNSTNSSLDNDDESNDEGGPNDDDDGDDEVNVGNGRNDVNEPNDGNGLNEGNAANDNHERRKQIIGKYLLFLRGCTNSTYDDVLGTLENMNEVVTVITEEVVQEIRGRLLQLAGLDLNEYVDVQGMLANINVSEGLHSIYLQNKYFKEQFNVVFPQKVKLGSKFIPHSSRTVEGNQPIKRSPDEFIHIPISEVLPTWLANGTFGNVVNRQRAGEDGFLESYMDGSHFKNHPYKLRKPNSKFLKLYYDEIEMCDSAGTKAGLKNKLGMFYWTDEDISRTHSSQLKFINVVGIVPNPHTKEYGINKLLKYIVDDIKKLEAGIVLPNGEELCACVSAVVCDNLAAHEVGGFRKSFVARHPCRVCMAENNQVRTMTKEDSRLLRTPEVHNRQVQEIQNAVEEDKNALRTAYGINGESVLNELEGFHVTNSLPPDLTHDDLEGLCIRTTRFFLKELCCDLNFMTLELFNAKVANFDYGSTEKSSKPSPITRKQILDKTHGFKQTAAQMRQLTTMIPFIVYGYVPEEWEPLQNYLLMLEIMLISNVEKMEANFLSYLTGIIAEYLEGFQRIYNTHLTPKQHSLVHRAGLFEKFGPLSQYRTIRYEAKHQQLKRFEQAIRNWKNPSWTLGTKHQLDQSYFLQGNLERPILKGPLKWFPIDLLEFKVMFPDVRRLQTTRWVKVNGKKYEAKKCIVAESYSQQNLPQFAAIDTILWRNDSPTFVCRKIDTVEHNLILMAYEIKLRQEYIVLRLEDLLSPQVFHSHKKGNSLFVIIKEALGRLH